MTHEAYQTELSRRAHQSEVSIIDGGLVKKVVSLVIEQSVRAKKEDVEINYSESLSFRERSAIMNHLRQHQGSLAKRVSFISTQVEDGPMTLIQIQKKGG